MDGMTVVVTIPGLKVQSEMNCRQHWSVVSKRKGDQKTLTRLFLSQLGSDIRDRLRSSPSVRVKFTRIGGRQLDTDNATTAFKFVRDEVAKWLGKDDKPGSGIEWELPPGQESGEFGVRIELTVPSKSKGAA